MTTTESPPADSPRTQKKSTTPWILFGVTLVGMVVFAGLYFFRPAKTVPEIVEKIVTNTVTNTFTNTIVNFVTNEVVKEVPREVEKIVTVQAPIPQEFLIASNLLQALKNAAPATRNEVLFNMSDVRVDYTLDNNIKTAVSEDEVKTKFELALRRNNVPVSSQSSNVIWLDVGGLLTDDRFLLSYTVDCFMSEKQFVFRRAEPRFASVKIWQNIGYGLVGKSKANQALLEAVEKAAERFANDYLSANPKPK